MFCTPGVRHRDLVSISNLERQDRRQMAMGCHLYAGQCC
jgi:hypothetical protein